MATCVMRIAVMSFSLNSCFGIWSHPSTSVREIVITPTFPKYSDRPRYVHEEPIPSTKSQRHRRLIRLRGFLPLIPLAQPPAQFRVLLGFFDGHSMRHLPALTGLGGDEFGDLLGEFDGLVGRASG